MTTQFKRLTADFKRLSSKQQLVSIVAFKPLLNKNIGQLGVNNSVLCINMKIHVFERGHCFRSDENSERNETLS